MADAHASAVHDLTAGDLDRGLRYLLLDGVSTQVMGALTGGALLVAFALLLGASNTVIGVIAAVGPLTQMLQLPSILLVERFARRKALVLATLSLSRLSWLLMAAVPWLVPAGARVPMLLVSLAVFFGFSSVSSAAFNSWKRDLLPDRTMAGYLGNRLAVATAAGAVTTLAAGVVLDRGGAVVRDPLQVYSLLFVAGAAVGLVGVVFLSRVPEPRVEPPEGQSLVAILTEPLRDGNFRQLLLFLALWNLAVNLAAPFFSVYMLSRLALPVAWVLGLSVVSQVAHLSFLPIWGRLADRLGSRAVLGLSGTVFVGCVAIWPFTTLPERYVLTVPLLLGIHLLAGIATGGVNLCAGTITLKLAPRGKATAFLATNALTSGVAATVAPVVAGLGADALAGERLSVNLSWLSSRGGGFNLTALDLEGLDFLFVAAVLLGLYALHRLLAVHEEGVVEDEVVLTELYSEVRKAVRHVSNIAGLRHLTYFPYALLRQARRVTGTSPRDQFGDGSGNRSS